MDVNVSFKKLFGDATPPVYQHDGDAGADIAAYGTYSVEPGKVAVIGTGIAVALPYGWEMQVRSRSGLAAKKAIFVLNSPGTVDSGYRDEVKVILFNAGTEPFVIKTGDRIAQAVVAPTNVAKFMEVASFEDVGRGGGLGSTGV